MEFLTSATLKGNSDSALEAIPKQQVDALIAACSFGTLEVDSLTTTSTTDSNSAGSTTISGFSITATLSSSRCYILYFTGGLQSSSTSADNMTVQLWENLGTDVQLADTGVVYSNNRTNTEFGNTARAIINAPSSGSHTYYAKVYNVNGSFGTTVSVRGETTNPALFILQDIGPAV
jgi:hypothetical protein